MNQTDILQHQTRQLKQFVPASYCDGLMTGEWSAWSWSSLVIAASPLPPLTTNRIGYLA